MSYDLKRNNYGFKDLAKPPHIVIMHAVNLINTKGKIDSSVRKGSYRYSFGKWQEYSAKYLNRYSLPMHRYMEFLDKDYVSMDGLDITRKSFFLEEMQKASVINTRHEDDFLIVIDGNLEYDVPDDRFYQMLTERILSPLFHEFNLTTSDFMTFDDIITNEFSINNNGKTPDGYEYHPMKNWDWFRFEKNFSKLYRESNKIKRRY